MVLATWPVQINIEIIFKLKIKSSLYAGITLFGGITPKSVTSGGAYLRGLASGQRRSEEIVFSLKQRFCE